MKYLLMILLCFSLIDVATAEALVVIAKTGNTDSIGVSDIVRIKVSPNVTGTPRRLIITKNTGIDSCDLTSVQAITVTRALEMVLPRGGSTFAVGDRLTISWRADFERVVNGVYMAASPDNGRTWIELNMNGTIRQGDPEYSGTTGVFTWVIPATLSTANGETLSLVSTACKVRVIDYNLPGTQNATSDAFTIVNQ